MLDVLLYGLCKTTGMRGDVVRMAKSPTPDRLEVQVPLRVKPYDIDVVGVVSNIVYVRWMEDLRLAMLDAYLPLDEQMADGIVPAILKVEIEYKRAIQIARRSYRNDVAQRLGEAPIRSDRRIQGKRPRCGDWPSGGMLHQSQHEAASPSPGQAGDHVSATERPRVMPQTPHIEKHFTASEVVRDIVIGMSDGLTVPFALAAGLSGAVDATSIVITAGLAEVAAGSIAMGLGGYLAARTDAEHYATERETEVRETVEMPEVEAEEVAVGLQILRLARRDCHHSRQGNQQRPEPMGRFHDEV